MTVCGAAEGGGVVTCPGPAGGRAVLVPAGIAGAGSVTVPVLTRTFEKVAVARLESSVELTTRPA